MNQGIGNINYQTNPAAGSLAAGALNDGLSVTAGIGKLGGPSGAAAAAVLLDNREIPMAGFQLLFSGIGNTTTGNLVFKADAARTGNLPYMLFQDSTGAETGRINFNNNDTFIGRGVGANVASATTRNTGVGSGALAALTTAILNTAIGVGAMSSVTGPGTVGASVAVGDGALQFYTSGTGETGVGYQALLNIQTGSNNTGIGIQAGGALYGTSSGNTFIGGLSGYNVARAAIQVNNNTIAGANSANNQGTVGNTNCVYGANFNNALLIACGDNNVFYGANQTTSIGAPSNSGMFGQGMDMQVSNTIAFGRADQNVIIGSTVTAAAPTNKLKVVGNFATGGAAPLTLGAGNMDFGKVVTAASVLNAAKYLEMSVDGVLVKVCIN